MAAGADLLVVGGGIVGLAVARELARRHPGVRVRVLEAEDDLARGQTGQSSGVVHAGLYYAPGSLKAELCRTGSRELLALCEERGIAHEHCGKLVVATTEAELPRLAELERRGRANGVPGLRRLGAEEIAEVEPAVRGVAALHSPATAIADFPAVTRALADDLRALGGTITTGARVTGVESRGGEVRLTHAAGEEVAAHAVFCAGHDASRLAERAGAPADPRIVPFRGAYLRLRPEWAALVRALVYPVPDPRLPFLGVHLTRHVSGDVLVGPTALLAGGVGWPGTWRLARRFWRAGLGELHRAASRRAVMAEAARLVPGLTAADADPAFTGVRAQAVARDGGLVDDFAFSPGERTLHVRSAPSPAASSALAIARHVASRAEAHLLLGPPT